jgi:hypothetical protein
MEYLFSFNDFCLIINNFFSIYKTNNIHNLKLIHDYKNNNNVIYLTKEKKLHYSKKNSKLEYIFTDNNLNNFIKILHNYKLFVFNKKVNPFYQFCFHLNFNQMKSLYLASKKQGIKYLFEKMIIFDKENMKIKLKYDYLDNFSKKDLNSGNKSKRHKKKINLDSSLLLLKKISKKHHLKSTNDIFYNNNSFNLNIEFRKKNKKTAMTTLNSSKNSSTEKLMINSKKKFNSNNINNTNKNKASTKEKDLTNKIINNNNNKIQVTNSSKYNNNNNNVTNIKLRKKNS